jgi:hypothetical protein
MPSISANKIRYKNNCINFSGDREQVCVIPTVNIAAFLIEADYNDRKKTLVFALSSGNEIKVYIGDIPDNHTESWSAYSTFLKAWISRYEDPKPEVKIELGIRRKTNDIK